MTSNHPQHQVVADPTDTKNAPKYQTGLGCLTLTAFTIVCLLIFIVLILLFGPDVAPAA